MKPFSLRQAALIAALCLLTACGGGGGSDGEIHVWGYGAGTYNIADNNFVVFVPAGGPTYSAVTHSLTSGSITFSEFGEAGGKVRGTFDVVSMIVGSPSQTARLFGSFSANRN